MPQHPSVPALGRLLAGAHARLRRTRVLREALQAASRFTLALTAVVALGVVLPLSPATATARLALLAAGATVLAALAVREVWRHTPRLDGWLEQVETRFPEVRSWLRNALDLERRPPAHGSTELADAVRHEAAKRLTGVPLRTLEPSLGLRGVLARTAGAAATLLLLAGFAPQRTMLAWRTLADPAIAAPPLALRVEPRDVTVWPRAPRPGRARVTGTTAAPRLLGPGASPAPVLEAEDGGARRWRFDLPPVTGAREYAVRVQRTQSPRYHITLAGEPHPVSFGTVVTAPAYARLPEQAGSSTSGDVSALRGSRVRVEVTYDRDLEQLASSGAGGDQRWQQITPRRWRGSLPVMADGEYTLEAVAASGRARTRYTLHALDDAPPMISVAEPMGDLDLPAGQRVPFDVQVQDDLGLAQLRLQWRKDAGSPWANVPVAAFRGDREARVTSAWDASVLALLPGESGAFRFEVTDGNTVSGPGRAVSPEFRLRFPSLADLYRSVDDEQSRAQQSLERVADQSRELQKRLEQLQRTAPRGQQSDTPRFERSEEMRKTLERQQEITRQIEQAAQQVQRSLDNAEERQAFREELQNKLREMSELMKQIQSQELKDAVRRMQQALEKMDPRQQEMSLEQMKQQNKEMMQNLQRSIELLKQLRDEERMEALAHRAEELKARQDQLNREHGERAQDRAPATRQEQGNAPQPLAQRQREAAEQSKQLAEDAQKAAEEASHPDAKEGLQQAAEELSENAAQQQQEAAEESERQQDMRASKSGQQASQSLDRAAQKMDQAVRSQSGADAARDLGAMRSAARDLLALQQSAQENLSSNASPSDQSNRQTDLSEGVARVADSLSALSKRTPFLSPEAQRSLGQAMRGLQQSGRELSQGNRARAEQEGQGAQAALNAAVLSLREGESNMCQNPGQGKPKPGAKPNPGGQPMPGGKKPGQKPGEQSARDQMGQMGRDQGMLNQRSRDLARRLSEQTQMSAGDQAEMRRLADEQARIREQLEGVQRSEEERKTLLGQLDQTHRDMQQVEEALRSGQVGDQLEDQQIRILSRLLDAQRSLNRRDFDPEREARHATDVTHGSAPELPGSLLQSADRLRQGLLKAGADRYPAQYRPFVEAYLRALNGSPR